MPKIIGFAGAAFSGKDTAAEAIKESKEFAGTKVEIFAFAKPLKDACGLLFNLTYEQLYDPILKEKIDDRWERSPREILQWLGTDILRTQINQDFFLMNMKQRIESSKADYILICDVRFDNESEYVRSLGGKIVKIIRDHSKNGEKTTEHSLHATEKGISDHLVDVVIENNCSIEEFKGGIKMVERFLFGTEGDGCEVEGCRCED